MVFEEREIYRRVANEPCLESETLWQRMKDKFEAIEVNYQVVTKVAVNPFTLDVPRQSLNLHAWQAVWTADVVFNYLVPLNDVWLLERSCGIEIPPEQR
jgi:hypothetical protein